MSAPPGRTASLRPTATDLDDVHDGGALRLLRELGQEAAHLALGWCGRGDGWAGRMGEAGAGDSQWQGLCSVKCCPTVCGMTGRRAGNVQAGRQAAHQRASAPTMNSSALRTQASYASLSMLSAGFREGTE